jgi:pimeloyl-ACP methyl ester carboxylesterase
MPPWLSLVLILFAIGAALCALVIYLMARMLLLPPRMNDGKALVVLQRLSPSDLDLKFEDLKFEIRDEATGNPLRLAAWWIPAGSSANRTILLIHGYGDAKVGAIAWAPLFHEMGWNIIALDLRAHGESGGEFSTAGYWERHDLSQVINRLRASRPRQTETLVLFGVSLGAAAALACAVTRSDLAALILEGPYANFRDAVTAHGRLFGAPGGWMQGLAFKLSQFIARADFSAVRPVDLIPRAPCPLMVIHAAEDCFMLKDEAQALAAALARRGDARDVFWEVSGAGHVLAFAAAPQEYSRRIADFLSIALQKRERSSATILRSIES